MTVAETLKDVQFVVGTYGQPTAALVDIVAWQRVIELLEEAEDQGLLRAYLATRRTARTPEELGLISWSRPRQPLMRLRRLAMRLWVKPAVIDQIATLPGNMR